MTSPAPLQPGDPGYTVLADRHPAAVFIKNLHLILGHDTAARIIGIDPGDRTRCELCQAGR